MATREHAPPPASLMTLCNRGCYFFEDRGVSVDFAEAARHFKLAADQHHSNC
jgi:TPR repeat protein